MCWKAQGTATLIPDMAMIALGKDRDSVTAVKGNVTKRAANVVAGGQPNQRTPVGGVDTQCASRAYKSEDRTYSAACGTIAITQSLRAMTELHKWEPLITGIHNGLWEKEQHWNLNLRPGPRALTISNKVSKT